MSYQALSPFFLTSSAVLDMRALCLEKNLVIVNSFLSRFTCTLSLHNQIEKNQYSDKRKNDRQSHYHLVISCISTTYGVPYTICKEPDSNKGFINVIKVVG